MNERATLLGLEPEPLHEQLYIADRETMEQAYDLIARYGDDAGFEAASLAERSRDVGNIIRFCHWRQIERVILLLASEGAIGTVH